MTSAETLQGLNRDERQALQLIVKRGAVSKNEAAKRLAFTYQKANRILESLLLKGLVVVSGEGESEGGRRPSLFSVDPALPLYILGVNISQLHLDVSVLTVAGRIVAEEHIPIERTLPPEQALGLITRALDGLLQKAGIPRGALVAGGVCFGCAIDPESGVILDSISNQFEDPRWVGFPFMEELQRAYGVRFYAETGANAACVGEYIFGQAQEKRRVCVVFGGYTSCRNGTMTDGRILRAASHLDTTLGHMVVKSGGEKCVCGNYGCVDAYATGAAVLRHFQESLQSGLPSAVEPRPGLRLEEILEAAETGDALAAHTVTEAAVLLGTGVANLANVLDPEMILFGGVMVEKSTLYREALFRTVRQKIGCVRDPGAVQLAMRSKMGQSANGVAALALLKTLQKEGESV